MTHGCTKIASEPKLHAETHVCVPYAMGTSIPVVCGFDSGAIGRDLKRKFSFSFNSVTQPGRYRTKPISI